MLKYSWAPELQSSKDQLHWISLRFHALLNLNPTLLTPPHAVRSYRGRKTHWPQAVWSWFRRQHPQAWRWLPIADKGSFFVCVCVKRVVYCRKNTELALDEFALRPFQKKWPLCKLKEQIRHIKCSQNPLEYTEMCQLFRGEDYPTVYGTNTIPKFLLGRSVAYCPTLNHSEIMLFQRIKQNGFNRDKLHNRILNVSLHT